ncbi:hypothetical protein D3C74_407530 [compost metagenome]
MNDLIPFRFYKRSRDYCLSLDFRCLVDPDNGIHFNLIRISPLDCYISVHTFDHDIRSIHTDRNSDRDLIFLITGSLTVVH